MVPSGPITYNFFNKRKETKNSSHSAVLGRLQGQGLLWSSIGPVLPSDGQSLLWTVLGKGCSDLYPPPNPAFSYPLWSSSPKPLTRIIPSTPHFLDVRRRSHNYFLALQKELRGFPEGSCHCARQFQDAVAVEVLAVCSVISLTSSRRAWILVLVLLTSLAAQYCFLANSILQIITK